MVYSDEARSALLRVAGGLMDAILDYPERVRMTTGVAPSGALVLTMFVHEHENSEFGRLIGREGMTAQAIRRIMTVAAAKYQAKVLVEIIDGGKRQVSRTDNGNI